MQLIHKQRARFMYGITEKQFSRYVKEAESVKGVQPADILYRLLETRLDNTVYRMGLAPTRRAARQLVAHGHICVNGKKITSPSHHVKKGMKISVREGSRTSILFSNLLETLEDRALSEWVSFDINAFEGAVKGEPNRPTVGLPFDMTTILEFYSR
jgi:small subunit ribosomal protein S4